MSWIGRLDSSPPLGGREILAHMEQHELVAQYQPLVRKIAAKVYRSIPLTGVIDKDDLISVGMMGMLDLAEKLSADSPMFGSQVSSRIYTAMMDELRKVEHHRAKASIIQDGSAAVEGITAPVALSIVLAEEAHVVLQQALSHLSPREQYLVMQHYGEDRSQKELAAEHGISEEGVRKALRRSRTVLRTRLERSGIRTAAA